MDHLRGIFTGAQITPVSLTNDYRWGELKTDPFDVNMDEHNDSVDGLHIHYAARAIIVMTEIALFPCTRNPNTLKKSPPLLTYPTNSAHC
jgi:hypothetical protein